MSKKNSTGAVVEAARKSWAQEQVLRLSTGHYAILRPVSVLMIQEIQSSVDDPDVPYIELKDKGRTEPNYNDPTYLRELQAAAEQRNVRTIEAIIMLGVELTDEDGAPYDIDVDGVWLQRLRYLERRGVISLADHNLDDPFDLEFLYKKFVAVAAPDLEHITKLSGVREEEIQEAVRQFRSNAE